MLLAIAAAVLCAYIAPSAACSGIPEVKAYLNGVDAHSMLAPTTLFVKVSLGLRLGFEPKKYKIERKNGRKMKIKFKLNKLIGNFLDLYLNPDKKVCFLNIETFMNFDFISLQDSEPLSCPT